MLAHRGRCSRTRFLLLDVTLLRAYQQLESAYLDYPSRVAPPFPQPCRIVLALALALLHEQLAPLFVRYLTQPRPLLSPASLSTRYSPFTYISRCARPPIRHAVTAARARPHRQSNRRCPSLGHCRDWRPGPIRHPILGRQPRNQKLSPSLPPLHCA